MKRAAIIGLGAISAVHVAAITENDFADIIAICDIDAEKLVKTAAKIPHPVRTYTDYKAMLAEVKPEVVHICTPHFLHKAMAIDSMRAGCDVYLEKPAALNYDEGLEILAVEKETGKKVCVSFQNRVIPTNLTAKKMIDSGELGAFRGARAFMTWNRSGAYYTQSPWRGRFATEGGGVLMNQSIHTLDLLYYFGGKIDHTQGTASLRKNADIIEVEDTAEATVFYESGKTAIFYATNCNVTDASVMVEVYLEKGKLLLQDNRLYKDVGNGYELVLDDSAQMALGKMVWGNGHAMMMNRFYASLDGKDEYYCTLEDALPVLKVIGDIYECSGEHTGSITR